MNRNYESMLIVRPDLTGEEQGVVFQRITKKINSLEGEVQESKIWIKEKDLYFPIRGRGAEKKKYNKGTYWFLLFSLNPDKIPDLREEVRLEERILRNIIIKK